MVIGFAPVAFGQVVETKGQNYDLIEDFTIGEAKWTSHPERINNNGWQNYFLQTENQKIIFRSNSVGGFIYDISSCSYSLYENGYDGNLIIPSVSSVATYLKDGTWQNMAVNEESCDVNFSQNENGIFLTSTKILTQTITNGTNANGTAITFDVETERFTHEIKVDIFGGVKETFKVWNESDEQLGISQTVHTGETITVGENTIDIAQFNGQSFDKQFLEDNQARIFEIANGLNYDFDLGFESLTGINIISESSFFDTTYKVNLDYSNGGFVNYLEIDPTFTTTNHRFYYENDGNSTCNDTSSGASQSTMGSNISVGLSKSTGEDCYRGAVEFDISSISDSAVITDLSLDLNIVSYYNNVGATSNCDIRSLTAVQPTVDNAGTMFTGIDDGTLLLNDDFCKASGGSVGVNTFNLGSTGISEITNQLPNDWFALGFHQDNDDSSGTLSGTPYYVTFNTPELTVTYTVPTAPQPPTNLQTVDGQPIELSWTAPVDDGNSAITGYKVYRTQNEFAMTALPNNGGTTGVDFTDNELLLHGDSITSTTPDLEDDFSSATPWTFTGSGASLSNDELYINFGATDNDHRGYRDIGTSINGDLVLQFKLTKGTQTGNTNHGIFLLDNPSETCYYPITTGVKCIGLVYNHYTTPNLCPAYVNGQTGNQPPYASGSSCVNIPSPAYVTMRVDGTTQYLEVYDDEARTNQVGSTSGTIVNAGITNLDSFYAGLAWTTSSRGGNFYIDDLEIYNGITSIPIPTAPDNSPNTLTVTANAGTTTTGVISNAISAPDLEVTSSLLPDGTDSFTVGGWVSQTATPTNTKLLGLNDVTFNVGTTTASVVETTSSETLIAQYDNTVSGWSGYLYTNEMQTPPSIGTEITHLKIHTGTGSANVQLAIYSDNSGSPLNKLAETASEAISSSGFHELELTTPYTVTGSSALHFAILVSDNSLEISRNTGSGITGVRDAYIISSFPNSLSGVSNQNQNQANPLDIRAVSNQNNNIISATGLTDNTSTPQHYTFTRDGNNWTIYQNGVSEATATDSTSLGSTSGSSTVSQLQDSAFIKLRTGSFDRGGMKLESNSALIGSTLTDFSFWLYKAGAPTGTATATIRDSTDTIVETLGTVDVSTLGTNTAGVEYTFTATRTLQAGDRIQMEYSGGSSGNDVRVNYYHSSDVYDGSNTVTTWYTSGTGYTDTTTRDLKFSLTKVTQAPHITKLDGSLDEFFINSDVLSASEIQTIYGMGSEPTLLATTSTTPEYDDSNVSSGNTYYYYVKATNAIGDSDFSTKQSGIAGTPPDAPTGLTTTIQDVNASPLDISLSWSSPTNVGTGTLTGFEIWRDSSLLTTTGLVTSYTDTVPSSGTYSYQVKAVSTHGTSGFSNSASQTTPTVPNAITDLSATVDSDTQISLSWSAPTNGGSAITGYKVFQDGVQIATPTSASYVVTGLTSNTQYTFKVIAVNNVGDSADSNLVTPTTYDPIVGSINLSSTVQGATVKFDFSANVTSGTPTPNFNTFTLKEGATVIASNISTPYYYALPDISSHTFTITSTDNTHWNTPTISGTASNIVAGYVPNWENSLSYNYTRTSTTMNLFVNQDRQDLWDLNCNYRTTAQIIANNNGVNGTMTNDWYYSDTQAISDADTVYVECTDATGTILTFTSYNTNRIGAGIALLDNVFSEWTGTPVALVFVLLVAGLFSGRSAPAGILLVLAIVGVMGFIGLLVIDELIWAFILLAGILGLFMGKRFL